MNKTFSLMYNKNLQHGPTPVIQCKHIIAQYKTLNQMIGLTGKINRINKKKMKLKIIEIKILSDYWL